MKQVRIAIKFHTPRNQWTEKIINYRSFQLETVSNPLQIMIFWVPWSNQVWNIKTVLTYFVFIGAIDIHIKIFLFNLNLALLIPWAISLTSAESVDIHKRSQREKIKQLDNWKHTNSCK